MEKYYSQWKLIASFLLYQFQTALLASCPTQCDDGLILKSCVCVPCGDERFWSLTQGHATCNRCTPTCARQHHMVQLTACSARSDRTCHCQRGFFCPSALQRTCRRNCEPCGPGTFSDEPSLVPSCRPHTDCTRLQLTVIEEGTDTRDNVCGHPTTTPQITVSPNSLHSDVDYNPPEAIAGSSVGLFLLLVVVLLTLFLCTFWYRGQQLRHRLKWMGMPFWKYNGTQNTVGPSKMEAQNSCPAEGMQNVEVLLPLGSEFKEGCMDQGTGLWPGGIRQVSAEHSGQGERISNIVGSIYIYSPGTVVLGANSLETEEKTWECQDSCSIIGKPQQESHSLPSDTPAGLDAPEENGKELGFPVPAITK